MVAEKIIAIVSGKGGVGKTVTTLNLGIALSKMQPVTVVDADITAANLALHLGLTWFPITLQDVLSGGARIKDAVYEIQGLRIVPSSLSNYADTKTNKLRHVLSELNGTVIIDSPPGFGKDVHDILEASSHVIIVTTPEIASITNAMKMLNIAKRKSILGIILNRHQGFLKKEHIEEVCEAPVIGVVPEDKNMAKSAFEKKPLMLYKPYSKASIEYTKIASRLAGTEYKPPLMNILRRLI